MYKQKLIYCYCGLNYTLNSNQNWIDVENWNDFHSILCPLERESYGWYRLELILFILTPNFYFCLSEPITNHGWRLFVQKKNTVWLCNRKKNTIKLISIKFSPSLRKFVSFLLYHKIRDLYSQTKHCSS